MDNFNKYNITKWYKMITGKSILHVNQGVGQSYVKDGIAGYYNDLTEKVLKDPHMNRVDIPQVFTEKGEKIIFSIAVFQYGLGSYDLHLQTKEKLYFNKFRLMAEWAVDNQDETGAWNTFSFIYPNNPYSAMAQGEGASLLIRAYKESGNTTFLEAARRAIEYMLLPIENGGTTMYLGNDVFFKEFTHKPIVLNGWIFALFGLYDYIKMSSDVQKLDILNKSIKTIEKMLPAFDNGYWSMYDEENKITSLFYHNLHIAQLNVLYDLFGIQAFDTFSKRWNDYRSKWFNRQKSFAVKAFQKLSEK
jgi:D-glucuronyl C5-epimerase C-terminus.